jgi:V8-like Glu-specific endopeptidase
MIGQNIRDAQENEFPYVVSFMRIGLFMTNPQLNHICTGTLITRKDVVTSEHCIVGRQISNSKIMVGSVNLRITRRYYILWWISYKQWANGQNITIQFSINDIAVVRVIIFYEIFLQFYTMG